MSSGHMGTTPSHPQTEWQRNIIFPQLRLQTVISFSNQLDVVFYKSRTIHRQKYCIYTILTTSNAIILMHQEDYFHICINLLHLAFYKHFMWQPIAVFICFYSLYCFQRKGRSLYKNKKRKWDLRSEYDFVLNSTGCEVGCITWKLCWTKLTYDFCNFKLIDFVC